MAFTWTEDNIRADSRFAPSQWETVLLCNDASSIAIDEQKIRHNNPICASTDDDLSIGSTEKQCLQTGRVCDVVEIPQSRMATATSRPPVRDIRDTESTEGLWPISDAH